MLSTLRRLGCVSRIGVLDRSRMLNMLLFKNRFKVQIDFMSQAVSKSGLSAASTLLAYDIDIEQVPQLDAMFSDVLIIACWNRDFGYEEWLESLYQLGSAIPIYRDNAYQVVVVSKWQTQDYTP